MDVQWHASFLPLFARFISCAISLSPYRILLGTGVTSFHIPTSRQVIYSGVHSRLLHRGPSNHPSRVQDLWLVVRWPKSSNQCVNKQSTSHYKDRNKPAPKHQTSLPALKTYSQRFRCSKCTPKAKTNPPKAKKPELKHPPQTRSKERNKSPPFPKAKRTNPLTPVLYKNKRKPATRIRPIQSPTNIPDLRQSSNDDQDQTLICLKAGCRPSSKLSFSSPPLGRDEKTSLFLCALWRWTLVGN